MTEVLCIGTSDAFGSGGRRQSAYLVRTANGSVLLDCGPTTGTGLASLEIQQEEVEAIVVSHFHADHFGGIPLFLLAALYQDRRRRPLRIAGPPQIEARVRRAARALGHPMESQRLGFEVQFQELAVDRSVEVGPVEIRAFQTRHSPESHPHGVVVQAGRKRVSYSGDTGWFQELPEQVRGSDLFLCECTFTRRVYEYHLSLEELADQASRFHCDRMLLTHLGQEMRARSHHAGFEVADDDQLLRL